MAMDTQIGEGPGQGQDRVQHEKDLLTSRHSKELDELQSQKKTEKDGIIRAYMMKNNSAQDVETWNENNKAKEQELSRLEEKYQQLVENIRARHAEEESAYDRTFQGKLQERPAAVQQGGNMGVVSTEASGTAAAELVGATTVSQDKPVLATPAPPAAAVSKPQKPMAQVQRQVIDGHDRLMFTVTVQAVATDRKKRKAPEPEDPAKRPRLSDTGGSGLGDHALAPKPDDLPRPDSEQDTDMRNASETERTITYAEVRRRAIELGHWDAMIRHPERLDHWYVIFCEEHQIHFKRNALAGAAKHLNSTKYHKVPNRDRLGALKTLGFRVVDYTDDQVTEHNLDVDRAYLNGYQPENNSRPQKKGSFGRRVKYPFEITDIPGPRSFPSKPPKPHKPARPPVTSSASHAPKAPRDLITNPKAFYIYYGDYDEEPEEGQPPVHTWPVLILGWNDQRPGGLRKSLRDTGLLDRVAKPPNCYIYDEEKTKIVGWAEGFEDGGKREAKRKVPVMFFDESHSFFWLPVSALSRIAFERRGAPKTKGHSERAFQDARAWIAAREGYRSWNDRAVAKKRGRLVPWTPEMTKDVSLPMPGTEPVVGTVNDDNDDGDYYYDDDETSMDSSSSDEEDIVQTARSRGRKVTTRSTPSPRRSSSIELGAKTNTSHRKPPTPKSLPINTHTKDRDSLQKPSLAELGGATLKGHSTQAETTATDNARSAAMSQHSSPQLQARSMATPKGAKDITSGHNSPQPKTMSVATHKAKEDAKLAHSSPQQPPQAAILGHGGTVSGSQGKTQLFEISSFAGPRNNWQRPGPRDDGIKMFETSEGTLRSEDSAIDVVIDPAQCAKLHLTAIEFPMNSLIIITLKNKEVIKMIFDRKEGNNPMKFGKVQAREFMKWLQKACKKLGYPIKCTVDP